MSESSLVLHRGAVAVSRERLAAIEAPPPSGRWFPVKHATVLETVCATLEAGGYRVTRERVGLGRDNHRMFATLDLDTPLVSGVALAVGVRNSTDKSFPLGFCAGNRVFVCDNLAFHSELMVKRKHTRFGGERFSNAIAAAVQSLASFKQSEVARVRRLMATELSEDQAVAFLVRAMEARVIAAPTIPKVLAEWRRPSRDYGTDDRPTTWTLLNCFTTVLAPRAVRSPSEYAAQTIRLNHLLGPAEPLSATAA